MNSNAEQYDQDCYPIGYMINGGSTVKGPTYDIVDIRTLDVLCITELASREIAPIAKELNQRMRDGTYTLGQPLQISMEDAGVRYEFMPEPEKAAEDPVVEATTVVVEDVAAVLKYPAFVAPTIPSLPTLH